MNYRMAKVDVVEDLAKQLATCRLAGTEVPAEINEKLANDSELHAMVLEKIKAMTVVDVKTKDEDGDEDVRARGRARLSISGRDAETHRDTNGRDKEDTRAR